MAADSAIRLYLNARIRYPEFMLDIDHEFTLDGATGLFGASGSGKSTLLRLIAGFERSASGQLVFDDDCWQDSARRRFLPAFRRPVGFVFQDTRLLHHLDVSGNLQFASRRSKSKQQAIGYPEVVSAFDLQALLSRGVAELSGGERQRVAIARTLLTQPRILLLDEPLAALDLGRKSEILPYLESLPERFGMPVIYVSHAVEEVARLCDRVVVLEAGRIGATGQTADALNHLDAALQETLPGDVTVIEAQVTEQLAELQLTRLDHCGQPFVVPMLTHLPCGTRIRLSVRASDVAIATESSAGLSFRNILNGTVASIEEQPGSAFATVFVDIGAAILKAQLTRHAVAELKLSKGMAVFALLKTASFDHRG
jgi:molybdate transport system ATP-binding protein